MTYVTFLIFLLLLLTLTHWSQSSDSKNKDNGKKNESNKENVKVDEVPKNSKPSIRETVVDPSLTEVERQTHDSIAEKQTLTDNLQIEGCETKNHEITSELKVNKGAYVSSSSLKSISDDGSVEKSEKSEELENGNVQNQDGSSNENPENLIDQHAHGISVLSTEGSIKSPDISDETYNSDAESDASFEAINPKEKIGSSLSNSGIG
jgi:hypothetical protein